MVWVSLASIPLSGLSQIMLPFLLGESYYNLIKLLVIDLVSTYLP